MRIAVTGAQGQLGAMLCRLLGPQAAPLPHAALDIGDADAVARTLQTLRPTAVVNSAAYTQVDRAEDEPDQAKRVNATAVGHLALACRRLDIPLVQVSTDYVFGGPRASRLPWREDETPQPQGIYAHSKLAGELEAQRWQKHFVVRTCGLYGHPLRWHNGPNFVDTMLRLGQARPQLRVVHDQVCTPSFTADVAAAILVLLASERYGTYHVTNSGSVSWYDFAREIFRLAEIPVSVEPITAAAYGARAQRPEFSVLDGSRYAALQGPPLRSWQDALAAYLQQKTA